MPKTSACLKVPKEQGERTITLAGKLGLIDKSLGIQRDEKDLYFPLIRHPQEYELQTLKQEVPETQLASGMFTEKTPSRQTLPKALEGKLSSHLRDSLPKAFDVIGDIAILEVPPELKPYETIIGQAMLSTHKNIRTVLAKASAISGAYRTREFTLIAGEHKTQTVHHEFGCKYYVDLAKVYFSPRLSHERERVASLVKSGETVVDLFAGVGPFSVLMAKANPNVQIYAVDLNPDAVALLRINVRINRVENRVHTILGDARQLAATKLKNTADMVIMNLPETAIEFVETACQAIKLKGGIIHFYAFIREPDSTENLKARFTEAIVKNGRKVEAFLYAKKIRETAPYESQVVLDAKIV
jgi:tRNA (guanine37-N1)-methyltransferase